MTNADWLVALAIAAAALGAGFLMARGDRRFRIGFAYGAGLLGLIGLLTVWALRDAAPEGVSGTAAGSREEVARMAPPTPSPTSGLQELAGRIRALDDHIVANPEDLEARRELGYVLLSANRFTDAAGQAGQILARRADDVDALYIEGVARLALGERDLGRQQLERAIATDPSHLHSLVALGTVQLQDGDYAAAIDTWERALAAAGGTHPGIERLLAGARQGLPAGEIVAPPSRPLPADDP